MTGDAPEKEHPRLLVQDGVWTAAGVTGHILLDVPPEHVLNVFLLKTSLHNQLAVTINGSACSQLGNEERE